MVSQDSCGRSWFSDLWETELEDLGTAGKTLGTAVFPWSAPVLLCFSEATIFSASWLVWTMMWAIRMTERTWGSRCLSPSSHYGRSCFSLLSDVCSTWLTLCQSMHFCLGGGVGFNLFFMISFILRYYIIYLFPFLPEKLEFEVQSRSLINGTSVLSKVALWSQEGCTLTLLASIY